MKYKHKMNYYLDSQHDLLITGRKESNHSKFGLFSLNSDDPKFLSSSKIL
jgi:hypothetical protein